MPKKGKGDGARGKQVGGSGRPATNAEYAAEIAEVAKLTAADVDRMFPTHSEKNKLVRLLDLTNSQLTAEKKADKLEDDVRELANVIFKLVRKLVLTG